MVNIHTNIRKAYGIHASILPHTHTHTHGISHTYTVWAWMFFLTKALSVAVKRLSSHNLPHNMWYRFDAFASRVLLIYSFNFVHLWKPSPSPRFLRRAADICSACSPICLPWFEAGEDGCDTAAHWRSGIFRHATSWNESLVMERAD